jgi:hypothetical protein
MPSTLMGTPSRTPSRMRSSKSGRTRTTPQPAKKHHIVVHDQCQQREKTVRLRRSLEEHILQGPIQEAGHRIDPLCHRAQAKRLLLGAETKAKVQIHRKREGRKKTVVEQLLCHQFLLKIRAPCQQKEHQRSHVVHPSRRCQLLHAEKTHEIVRHVQNTRKNQQGSHHTQQSQVVGLYHILNDVELTSLRQLTKRRRRSTQGNRSIGIRLAHRQTGQNKGNKREHKERRSEGAKETAKETDYIYTRTDA